MCIGYRPSQMRGTQAMEEFASRNAFLKTSLFLAKWYKNTTVTHQLKSNPSSSKKSVFIRSGCFSLFPKADCIIFAASLFWVINSISVESDSFRLESITFYFQTRAWNPLFASYPKESSPMDHSTWTRSPFSSFPFCQLFICFSEAPGQHECLGESLEMGVNKPGKSIILQGFHHSLSLS